MLTNGLMRPQSFPLKFIIPAHNSAAASLANDVCHRVIRMLYMMSSVLTPVRLRSGHMQRVWCHGAMVSGAMALQRSSIAELALPCMHLGNAMVKCGAGRQHKLELQGT